MLTFLRFFPAQPTPLSFRWVFLLLMVLPGLTQAQCPVGDITLTSQAQVDAISPGCVLTDGYVHITGGDITNLNGLRNLRTIKGELRIANNPQLTSIAALTALTSIGRGLQISNNALLPTLDGLDNLQSVPISLELENNPRLISISALKALTKVNGTLRISNNALLPTLDGLDNLRSVDAGLELVNNPRLISISALKSLTSITIGSMRISGNALLPTLDGLDNLQSAGGRIELASNPQLTSIAALTALTSVGTDLRISGNTLLPTLQGLNNLQSVGGSIMLTNNSRLAVCALGSICNLLAQDVPNSIGGNAPGCNSEQDVQDNCSPLAITTQPPTQSAVCQGSGVTASVSTSNNARAYQWYKEDQPVAGQTTNTLSLTNVQPADAGTYRVVVSNSGSSLTSTAFTLTVTPTSPDYQPLVDLYNSTYGPNWINKTNWLTGCSPCGWYGVNCDANGRVTRLDLSRNNLSGPIPASLGNLTSLQLLNLYRNELTGPIPTSLGNLTRLHTLSLFLNQLTGSIPVSLGNLTRLDILELNYNQLSGSIPESLGNLPNLLRLNLGTNQLSGSIPASLGNLRGLQELSLMQNQLSGSIPASLGNLTNLQNLVLAENQLTGSIPESLSALVNLQVFNLANNALSGPIPTGLAATLAAARNLRQLSLRDNQLSGCFPASLSAVCGKTGINFSGNPGLPGGGNFAAFCASGAGSDAFRPLATASPNPVCAGNPVSLSVSAGTFYQWSGPAGFTASTQTPGFTPATTASSGLYSVTVGNGSPTCTATATASITVNPTPSVSVSPSASTVCAGQTVTLSATPGLSSYSWSTGQSTASIAVTATGTYAVTATNASGCSATASASVTVRPTPPTPTITTQSGQSGQIYPGGQSSVTVPQYSGTVTLLISGCTGTINWQGPNGTSGSNTSIPVATSATGTFVYQATCQQNGCPSAVGSATVVVQGAPLTVVAPLLDCATGKLTLRTTGGNGQPIEYQIPSVTNGWQATNPVSIEAKDFKKSLKLRARQRSVEKGGFESAELDYQLPACPGARMAASTDPEVSLTVTVLGNPLTGPSVSVEVRGAQGQALQFTLTNLQGRTVSERSIQRAEAIEAQTLPVGNQPAGLLLLRVSTPTQSQTVKVIKAE